MIRFVRYFDTPNKDLNSSVNTILEVQKIINANTNISEWDTGINDVISFNESNYKNIHSLILNDFISSIKEHDKLTVNGSFVNPYGNQFFFKKNKTKESLSVNYNLAMQESNSNVDVFYIKNHEKCFTNNDELLVFFNQLVEIFDPTHAVITHEDLVYDIIDFNTSEIWTGWMTYISKTVKIDIPQGFDFFDIKGLGKCIFTSKEFDIEDKEAVEKIIELTNYLRLNGSNNIKELLCP